MVRAEERSLGSVDVKRTLGNFQGLISKLHVGGGGWDLTTKGKSDPGEESLTRGVL